jgi:ElaB/YqjD/DUF883 family membrane-anchored ribosome-binding protein
MATETLSNEKIDEALQLLSEAAKEKRQDIRNMISDRYAGLKGVLGGATSSMSDAWSSARQRASERARQAKDVSMEKMQDYYQTVDQKVHTNPWPFIGGVALGTLLLGYLMGRGGRD